MAGNYLGTPCNWYIYGRAAIYHGFASPTDACPDPIAGSFPFHFCCHEYLLPLVACHLLEKRASGDDEQETACPNMVAACVSDHRPGGQSSVLCPDGLSAYGENPLLQNAEIAYP